MDHIMAETLKRGIREAVSACHKASRDGGWWTDHETGSDLKRNKGEMLMLIVSEISEAMEGERKDMMDTHLTHRKAVEVELADALIRIFDYAGGHGYDIGAAMIEKMEFNANRADHKPAARVAAGGKKW